MKFYDNGSSTYTADPLILSTNEAYKIEVSSTRNTDIICGEGFARGVTVDNSKSSEVVLFEIQPVLHDEHELMLPHLCAAILDLRINITNPSSNYTKFEFTVAAFRVLSTQAQEYQFIEFSAFVQMCLTDDMCSNYFRFGSVTTDTVLKNEGKLRNCLDADDVDGIHRRRSLSAENNGDNAVSLTVELGEDMFPTAIVISGEDSDDDSIII